VEAEAAQERANDPHDDVSGHAEAAPLGDYTGEPAGDSSDQKQKDQVC
jgi:hypothetical protein